MGLAVFAFDFRETGPADARSLAETTFRQRLGIDDFGYPKLPSGRPAPKRGFDWSVSHSASSAFFAAAPFAIAVDIELAKPRRQEVWNALHPSFRSAFPDASTESFYAAWTAAEAVSKLVGKGVDLLPDIRLESSRPCLYRVDGVDFSRVSDIVSPYGRHVVLTGFRSGYAYSVAR